MIQNKISNKYLIIFSFILIASIIVILNKDELKLSFKNINTKTQTATSCEIDVQQQKDNDSLFVGCNGFF